MKTSTHPPSSAKMARKCRERAPEPLKAFKAFSAAVFAAGTLSKVMRAGASYAHSTPAPDLMRHAHEAG
jgi:hypothetical protein